MNVPVYEVQVTLKGRPALAPMTVIRLLGTNWAPGYIMPSGHHKKYNCKGNEYPAHTKQDAFDRLERLAAARGWKKWPEGRPQKCIFLDEEE
ncbi:MAG: hypothetical protein IJ822_04370 [Pyramidobacter sp.]|nr:hypothetical protein [Pyramidobacter sp.]MBQ8129425.1 hypothetical protein [Clostridia bacterium]MBR1895995.1 hypothetical protein [Pyramidobacter sp.]